MYSDKEKILAKGKKKEKMFTRVFGGVFTSIGLILFAVSIGIGLENRAYKREAKPVKAVIVAMRGMSSESLGTPVVEYNIGGKSYTSTLSMSSSSMYPNKQITVYYRENNPQEVRYIDENGWIMAVFFLMGLVFAGIGLAFMAMRRKKQRKINHLLATGKRIEAEITDIRENTKESMNGKHPIIISCRYVATNGRIYIFHSGSFWYHSYEIDTTKKIQVYVDRNNPSHYYVDVDSVVG